MSTPSDPQALVAQHLASLSERLLDLTNRNRLLNFVHAERSRSHVRVIDELPEFLYERLCSGHELEFRGLAESARGDRAAGQAGAPVDLDELARGLGLEPSYDLPRPLPSDEPKAHTDRFIQTKHLASVLDPKLEAIRSAYFASLHELGVPSLYAAFGFLEWRDKKDPERPLWAPLVLLPLALERTLSDGRYRYRASATTDDADTNLSLRLRLRRDAGIELPTLSDEQTLEDYLERVAALVATCPGWAVRRSVTIGIFQFARLVLHADLDPQRWTAAPPETHPIVRRLLIGGRPESSGTSETNLDSAELEATLGIPVVDADGSQSRAIVAGLTEPSLVLQGPPGSGKSQTITNLIAAALARGERVLFVAEKQAALEVVKKRLTAVGLAPFCLDLHDPNRKKTDFIDGLRQRLALRAETSTPPELAPRKEALERERAWFAELHHILSRQVEGLNVTVADFLCACGELRAAEPQLAAAAERVELPLPCSSAVLEQATLALQQVLKSAATLDPETAPPFAFVTKLDLVPPDYPEIFGTLDQLVSHGKQLTSLWTALDLPPTRVSWHDCRLLAERLASQPPALASDGLALLAERRQAQQRGSLRLLSESAALLAQLPQAMIGSPNHLARLAPALSQAAQLVSHCGLDSVPLAEFGSQLAQHEHQASCLQQALTHLVSGWNELGLPPLSLDCPREPVELALVAVNLLSVVSPRLLAARSAITLDERYLPQLVAAEARQLALGQAEANAEAAHPGWRLVQPERIGVLLRGLRETGAFGRWLSKDYAALVTEARQLCPQARDDAALLASLEALSQLHGARRAFESDAALAGLAGARFQGICTDFASLAAAARWATWVRERLATGSPVVVMLRDALLKAPTERLEALLNLWRGDDWTSLGPWLRESGTEAPGVRLQVRHAELTQLGQLGAALAPLCLSGAMRGQQLTQLASLATTLSELELRRWELQTNAGWPEALLDANQVRAQARWFAPEEVQKLPLVLRERLAQLTAAQVDAWREPMRVSLAATDSAIARLAAQTGATALSPTPAEPCVTLFSRLERAATQTGQLAPWLAYLKACAVARDTVASSLVPGPSGLPLPSGDLSLRFELAWRRSLEQRLLQRCPILTQASREVLSERRKTFASMDLEAQRLTRLALAAQLAQASVPVGVDSGAKRALTELSLLRHEVSKKRHHLPIRELFARAGDALMALHPCFLLSPLTVANFVPPGAPRFDLVVIDEASQMRPEEALGSLLRARRAVVVGDEHQLPPTSFFEKLGDSLEDAPEEELDEAITSESILDLASSAFAARLRLRWHYRSRHESLIAYSNQAFYDNDLLVFPAAGDSDQRGVRLERVAGAATRGLNPLEADVIVSAVLTFMREHPNRSLGVVAMNQAQAALIEERLDERIREMGDDSYRLQHAASLEPFFVKNLERVQGDERDAIFISLTYGPETPGGRLPQRFGPINGATGHRRLNVLFTRAKEQVVLFSSFGADDVVVGADAQSGVRALRGYLEFASRAGVTQSTEAEPQVLLARSLQAGVAKAEMETRCEVGTGEFRLPLTIKVANCQPLALLCDGGGPDIQRVRDRVRLLPSVLTGLGWAVFHADTTSTYLDRAGLERSLSESAAELLTPQFR